MNRIRFYFSYLFCPFQDFAQLPPQCVRCKPWPRLLPAKITWSPDDINKMRSTIDLDLIYSGRVGGDDPTTPVSLAIGSTDALEVEVILQDPDFDSQVGDEVFLNDELVRRGIAITGSPGRSSDSSIAQNSIEIAR